MDQKDRILPYQLSEKFSIEDLMKVSGGAHSGGTNNLKVEYTGPLKKPDVIADLNVDW